MFFVRLTCLPTASAALRTLLFCLGWNCVRKYKEADAHSVSPVVSGAPTLIASIAKAISTIRFTNIQRASSAVIWMMVSEPSSSFANFHVR
jgi:hypothetical protein